MPPITYVVKHLLIINVVLYFGSTYLFPLAKDALAMYYPTTDFFKVWQVVTHMFMHADFNHLFFNMFALYMFGSALEAYFGPKRFLSYYMLCGLGAAALYMSIWALEVQSLESYQYQEFVNTPNRVLGASGAVFGLLAGFGTLFPESRIMLLFPPIPMKAKYFVLIFAGLEFFLGISRLNPGVAHFAHLGGALFGFLIILYWRKSRRI